MGMSGYNTTTSMAQNNMFSPNMSYNMAGSNQINNISMTNQYLPPSYSATQPNHDDRFTQPYFKQEVIDTYPTTQAASHAKSKHPGAQQPSYNFMPTNSNFVNNSTNLFPNMNFNPNFQFKAYPSANPAPDKKLSKWKEKVHKSTKPCEVCNDRSSGWHYGVQASKVARGSSEDLLLTSLAPHTPANLATTALSIRVLGRGARHVA